MPELRPGRSAVTVCAAEASALERLVPPGHGSRMVRMAPDELLVLASPDVADTVEREVRDRITALDADALVLDVSDGWTAWSLRGDDAAHALSYLTALDAPAPGTTVHGDVARVAALIVGEDDGFTILVPAYHGEHIRERALHDGRATEVTA